MSRNPDSHDHLAEWLEQPPGTTPPDAIDPEVLEAVFALRPERAPAPRVSVDDILASVQTGPLAPAGIVIGEESETIQGEVVPFPVATSARAAAEAEADASAVPKPRRRGNAVKWMALMGGSGGLGLAMVAAATLLVVASPTMFRAAQGPKSLDRASAPAAMEPTPEVAAASRPAPAARSAGVLDELDADKTALGEGRVASTEAALQQPVAAAERPTESEHAKGDAYAMDPGNAFQARRDIIPEALEAAAPPPTPNSAPAADQGWNDDLADEQVVDAPLAEPEVSGETDASQPTDLSSARRDARPPRLSSDWRNGLDAERTDGVQAELDRADAQSGRARGAIIEGAASTVSGTSRQILAVWAAEAYLVGGSYRSAEGVARVGLAEGQAGSEAAWLYYVLGQALEAQGRSAEALTAYQDAAAQ